MPSQTAIDRYRKTEKYRKHNARRSRENRDAWAALGLCLTCGLNPPSEHNRRRCDACRAKYALIGRLWALRHAGLSDSEVAKAKAAWEKFTFICDACYGTFCGRWVFDHNHETKKFRGIVGHRCNTAIGFAHDDPRTLERIARYLRRAS